MYRFKNQYSLPGGMAEDPLEDRIFEINGAIWDYRKIAIVSYCIANEFLERLDMPDLDRTTILQDFIVGILGTHRGAGDGFYLIYPKGPFNIDFKESLSDSYYFNTKGDIVDYLGIKIPSDFEFDNKVYLRFSQRFVESEFLKDTPIPKMQAEEVMQFVEEVCKKYAGLIIEESLYDVPEVLQREPPYGIISKVRFDESIYRKGKGKTEVVLHKYEPTFISMDFIDHI